MALTQVSTGGIKDGQVQTADIADAQITAGKLHADALDRTYTLGADGSNHYTFTGEGLTGTVNDPTLYLTRGKTYRFVNGNSAGAHPFRIQTTVNGSAGTEYNTGVTNNGGAGGSTIVFEVPHDAPDVLYYQCTSHGSMGGIFYITGALADGGVTTAKIADSAVLTTKIADQNVTTAKIQDSAVTTAKIANSAVLTSKIAAQNITTPTIQDTAVTTAKIADSAVTSAKLGASAVTTGKINDLAVTAAKIADTTITSGQLAASSVTTSKINDGAVTDAKINGMAASKLTGALPAISGANLTNLPGGGSITRVFVDTAGTEYAGGVGAPGTEYLSVTVNNVTSDARYLIYVKYYHRVIGSNSQWYSTATFSTSNASIVNSGGLGGIQGYSTTASVLREGFTFDQASNTNNRTYGIYHRSSTTSSSGRSEAFQGFMVVLEFKV